MGSIRPDTATNTMTDEEIEKFFEELDADRDGYVTFDELEAKLKEVHLELYSDLQQQPASSNSSIEDGADEKSQSHALNGDGQYSFLQQLLPDCIDRLSRDEFIERVRTWGVPSRKQVVQKNQENGEARIGRRMGWKRNARAYWALHGPKILFLTFVGGLMFAAGNWQMMKYLEDPVAMKALGWGIVLAKLSAGALYPTVMFMLLSMSRHLNTFLRTWTRSRFINFDHSQSFHKWLSIVALGLAILHAIGHLAGDFIHLSRPENKDAVIAYAGPDFPRNYVTLLGTLPGWTGLAALGIFCIMALMAMPFIRKRHYEIFQLSHLLMFPFIALLCAHGSSMLLQKPLMGYWIIGPATLVACERILRFVRGFYFTPAKVQVLQDDAVNLIITHPKGEPWKYAAGQYVLIQVPKLSFFQWHPFTVSSCHGTQLQVHIKASGDWTRKLRDTASEDEVLRIGIDGPFGAPAQRFYDYDYSIIISNGIGVTPFSAILADVEEKLALQRDPWAERRIAKKKRNNHSQVHIPHPSVHQSRRNSSSSSNNDPQELETYHLRDLSAQTHLLPPPHAINDSLDISRPRSRAPSPSPSSAHSRSTTSSLHPSQQQQPIRRLDFHWTVREKSSLQWFSSLLNRAIARAPLLLSYRILDLHINAHITAQPKTLSTHVFRYLLDGFQTPSPLTGLRQRSCFGRPDFDGVLERHYAEMEEGFVREEGRGEGGGKRKVGVFYCGNPAVGKVLSDRCHEITAKARAKGLMIRYDFLMEVFD